MAKPWTECTVSSGIYYDASRRYYLLGRDRLLDQLAPPPGGSILEIGCGTGRNLIGAARRYPRCQALWHRHFARDAQNGAYHHGPQED